MDFSYLITISDGDKDFIKQFISTFETNTTAILEAMDQSFSAKDYDLLQKQAHQLKPSLEMLKLDSHAVCVSIQNDGASAEQAQIDQIKSDCLKATSAMRTEFNL